MQDQTRLGRAIQFSNFGGKTRMASKSIDDAAAAAPAAPAAAAAAAAAPVRVMTMAEFVEEQEELERQAVEAFPEEPTQCTYLPGKQGALPPRIPALLWRPSLCLPSAFPRLLLSSSRWLTGPAQPSARPAQTLPHSSFPGVPVARQRVYVCKTCTPPGSGRVAGVCYSCSISCHGDHDVIELYEKRDFICDCGNAKFHRAFA